MSSLAQTAARAPAPLALMALIFWLSAQPDLDTGLGVWDVILRKLAHGFVFGGLALLWCWCLSPLMRRPIPLAGAISLIYAALDEYHQTFVEGRTGSAVDVGIDATGILIALMVARRYPSPLWRLAGRRGRATKVQMSPERTRSSKPEAS